MRERATKSARTAGKAARGKAPKGKPAAPASSAPAVKKPVLLAGGNPQIAKGDGDGPVQAYLKAMPGWKREVGRRIDALVTRAVPGVKKAVRWNSPFYGVEGRGWFLSMHCLTRYLKVAFFRGAELEPQPPLESKMKDVRYAHVGEGEALDEALWTRWVRQAAALPGTECF